MKSNLKLWIYMVFAAALLLLPANVFASSDESPLPIEEKVGLLENRVDPIGKDAKVSSGYYVLYPACSKTRVATIAGSSRANYANCELNVYRKKKGQVFYIRAKGDGTYTLTNLYSGRNLGAAYASRKKKTNVRQSTPVESDYQRWYITKKSGKYVLQTVLSKNVLSVKGSKNKNKANIYLYTYRGKKGQRWTLKRYAYSGSAPSAASTSTASGKWKTTTRTWKETAADYKILANIIGAVESGGQIYGNLNYSAYAGPYASTSNEHTITLGWAQHYGDEARVLLNKIYKKDPAAFNKIDSVLPKTQRIKNYLSKNIVAIRWRPNAKQKAVLIKLISSAAGKAAQDEYFAELMKPIVADCRNTYTSNAWAVVMYCEIRHLGGKAAADRIFKRCKRDYSLNKIRASLLQDQKDSSSSYQVGDSIFTSRHDKCCQFLQTYM
ncbi:MAG: RICIN domain-containing protein [Lachnospiraceae bacterium]|nr:RICIN domain-containing protein [Lachnospiraceae bacterium]